MATAAQLTRLGLTSYEAKAYLALLRRDSLTAAQAARLANVPRQRIYDVLASLVEKGLAAARPGQVAKYAAVAPDLALERLVSDRRQQLVELERETAALIDELKPAFHAGKEHVNPLEYIEVLRDRGAINERFDELQAGIKQEILVFTKPPYATPPHEEVVGLEVSRTHEARSVYEFSVFDDPEVTEGVRRFVEAGEYVARTFNLKRAEISGRACILERCFSRPIATPIERKKGPANGHTVSCASKMPWISSSSHIGQL